LDLLVEPGIVIQAIPHPVFLGCFAAIHSGDDRRPLGW
jgi:hypothetical protein